MAEVAVSFICEKLMALVINEANLLRGVHKEFEFMKDELESIRAYLKDADRRAAGEREEREGIKTWVRQLREASFRIEDVVDQYMINHHPGHSRFAASVSKITSPIKTWKNRHQIASEIEDIKSTLNQIIKRSEIYAFRPFNEQGSSSAESTHVQEYDPRMAALFIEEAEVVGFEGPKSQLIGWLLGEEAERTVISVQGMGGLGKTTLAKKVFESQAVVKHFDFRAWITVSQSYNVKGLLREMIVQFCKERRESLPEDLSGMNKMKLIAETRTYLERKRYVIFFDDVWVVEFWGEIEHAIPDNKKRSRVVITTRKMGVADFCKISSLCHVYEQKPLILNDAWKLFCKKVFRAESDGHCPAELEEISKYIVQKCEGLPLAIVTIGGLLSTKRKVIDEWQDLRQNLSSELESNPHLSSLTRILAFSYDDLPYYLKSCFLYFGIYPEDYAINCARLTRQWIAEGFVTRVEGKSLEEVAEGYLTELIHRSLVQVSLIHFEGRAKSCRIHDMLREMIIRKMKDLSFARFVHDDDQPISDTITRRLAIETSSDSVLSSVGHSHIRAIYIFETNQLPRSFVSTFSTKFILLKVMDFENALLNQVPDNLGNLFHLSYLSFRNTNVLVLPKSIGKLLNLETLDLRNTPVREVPVEIKKLTKLRHLLVYQKNHSMESSLTEESGVQIKEGVGFLTSIQKLYYVQANHGGIDLIKELSRLKQLRKLGLKHVRREYGETLCDSINVMEKLESLDITAVTDEIIDLQSILSLPKLRRLRLLGRLARLPEWVPKLDSLVKITLGYSKLNEDPLNSLKNLPNLLGLSICNNAYDGEVLKFQSGKFQKLKNLYLERLNRLNSILIEEGALPVLEQFAIWSTPRLRVVPSGIRWLRSLQVLDLTDLPDEFNRSIDRDEDGHDYKIIEHVPIVHIRTKGNPIRGIDVYHTRTLRHPRRSQNSNALVFTNV